MKAKLGVILTAVLALGGMTPALATVAGSKHDFTATGGFPVTGVTEMCKTCHVPHRPLVNVPLWAHALSTYTYNLYNTNATYAGGNGAAYDASPAGLSGTKSALCLSCHDGTVAVAGTTFISPTSANWIMYNGGAINPMQGSANPTSGMMGSHPIAVNYNTVQTANPTKYSVIGNAAVKLDNNNKVQCTTCHNPHNPLGNGSYMTVISNSGSALCTVCHSY